MTNMNVFNKLKKEVNKFKHKSDNPMIQANKPLDTQFKNAQGSNIEQKYAMEARHNPETIYEMADTYEERQALEREALVRQYLIIVDKSGSMCLQDGEGSRWDSARKAVENFIDTILKYDVDGLVPLYLYDSKPYFIGEVQHSYQVLDVFKKYRPGGENALDLVLDVAMEEYCGRKRPNYEVVPGLTIIVLLDGAEPAHNKVLQVMQKFANPTNGYITNHTQLAIAFIQIGDDDSATDFLQTLDNNVYPDIAYTCKDDMLYQPNGLDKILWNAIFS